MNFDELNATAPLSFHDSFLLDLTIDYVRRQSTWLMEVNVADPNGPPYAERELYRQICLTFTGLLLCSVDAPNGEYLEPSPRGLQFDAAYDEQVEESGWPDEPLPPGAFRRTFYFTQDNNSRVRIAASDVTLEWLTQPRAIY